MDADVQSAKSFGLLVRRYRAFAALTQEELASRAGLSVRAVSDMERGRTRRPFLRSVRQLADALELAAPERARLIAAAEPAVGLAVAAGVDRADGQGFVLPVPRQLPSGVARFTGRAAELDMLAGLAGLAVREAGTAVVISGTAGVGKTALAVHFAREAAADFPDGQLYVNLRGSGPSGAPAAPEEAIRGFLGAFGLGLDRVPQDVNAQAALFRSLLAGRRVLVLLDNAYDDQQVRQLLPGSAGCITVVTSRRQLTGLAAADGARLLGLQVLSEDESLQLLAGRLGDERVDHEPEAAARVSALCAGLPLALSVAAAARAAARSGVPLAALAEELRQDNPLDALDVPPAEHGVCPEAPADHAQALAWFEAGHTTLLAAVGQAADNGLNKHAWQLPWALVPYFDWRGDLRNWVVTQRAALAAARRAGDTVGLAHAHRLLGRAYTLLGRQDVSRLHLTQALRLSAEDNNMVGQALAHHSLGHVCSLQGRHDEDLAHDQDALRLYEAAQHDSGRGWAFNAQAWALVHLGKYDYTSGNTTTPWEIRRSPGVRQAGR